MKKIELTLKELSDIIKDVANRDFFDEDICNDILCGNGVGSVVYELENGKEVRAEFEYNENDLDCSNYDNLMLTITYYENIEF